MIDLRDKKLAKRLARTVVEAGEADIPDLKPAFEKLLSGRPASEQKAFLRNFHKAVLKEIHKDTMVVESANELSDELVASLADKFSTGRSSPLYTERRLNPSLIAGVRVRVGDTVYDASLSSRLQALAARIH